MAAECPRVLFLCTGNSCRSQMAEGWAKHLLGDPPALAAGATTDEEAMRHYQRVRDEIGAFVETLPALARSSANDNMSTAEVQHLFEGVPIDERQQGQRRPRLGA